MISHLFPSLRPLSLDFPTCINYASLIPTICLSTKTIAATSKKIDQPLNNVIIFPP